MEEDIKILVDLIFEIKKLGLDEEKAQAIENLIKRVKELEESEQYLYDAYQDAGKKMFEYSEKLEKLESKIREKIEEQINEADDVLVNGHFLDNFNGDTNEQEHYYKGYKDCALFLQEILEDK